MGCSLYTSAFGVQIIGTSLEFIAIVFSEERMLSKLHMYSKSASIIFTASSIVFAVAE